jgi:hypothetical protein
LTLLEINHRAFPPIINDGVPEDYPVALGEVHDLEMLRAELEKDGLTVTEKTVSIECVVLSER